MNETLRQKIYRYKFLRTGLKSEHGNFVWKKGEWYACKETLDMCHTGFHCSKGIYQALSYVQGEILAKVEVKGKHLSEDTKDVWESMRVTKTYEWSQTDSVLFSIYAARLVLDIFEKYDSKDKRPREAIEAAERYINNPTKENKDAAYAAADAAAHAADAAAHAVYAAYAAHAAAYAANAAHAAAYAANAAYAAYAADAAAHAAYAAYAAHAAAFYKKLDIWMLKHLKELKEIK